MESPSFIRDILSQAQTLQKAISTYPRSAVESLLPRIRRGEIGRVILAGHGSSYNAFYPALIQLANLPIPVSLWQTAELVHYGLGQIDRRTLICLNSQSGSSVEMLRLVDSLGQLQPACSVAFTNTLDSPLAAAADLTIPLQAGEEHGVAVKTYLASMSLAILLSQQLTGADFGIVQDQYLAACQSIQEFLNHWQDKLVEYDQLLATTEQIIVVGRGPSMGSALNSALNQKEAAWIFTEGLNAAEFRHGPLELADERLSIFIMEGDPLTKAFNQVLAKEVQGYGSSVYWVGNHPPEGVSWIATPEVAEIFQPAADIIPMQLLAQVLAARKNKPAGVFRRIGKIVLVE